MRTGSWKKSKHMSLTNRGLETVIQMKWLPATESYRVTKIERMMGATPTVTHDRIEDAVEAVASFRHLCVEAIEQEFEFPDRAGTSLMSVDVGAQERIDAAYKAGPRRDHDA